MPNTPEDSMAIGDMARAQVCIFELFLRSTWLAPASATAIVA